VTIRLPAALAAITGLILLLVLGSLVEGGLLTTLALILIVTGSLGLIYTLLLPNVTPLQPSRGDAQK
jgi:hypothetical protein